MNESRRIPVRAQVSDRVAEAAIAGHRELCTQLLDSAYRACSHRISSARLGDLRDEISAS